MAFAACILWFVGLSQAAESASPERLAVGVNVIGGQLDYAPTRDWRVELRYVGGSQSSSGGTVSSQVMGLRGYRVFGAAPTRFYSGAEAAYVGAKQRGTDYRTTGTAIGAFIGLERRIARRLWIGIDAGPYVLALRESVSHASSTNVEFVLNSYALLWVF